MKRSPAIGRPAKTLQRQHRELWLLYVASLAGVLLLFALVLRSAFQQSQLALIRNNLLTIGEELSNQPPPKPGDKKALQATHKDFSSAHQQVEWFVEGHHQPVARLGERRNLGPLPRRRRGQRFLWQQGPDWISLVRPVDLDGDGGTSSAGGWLRISEGLENTNAQLHRLDASLTGAILLALVLSGVSARLISRRAVEPLEQSLSRLRQFSLDASHELRGPMAALAANAEMGLLEADPAHPSQRRRFEAIASATAQMELLVEDLLLLARQDELRPERFQRLNLSALIDSQIALHRDGMDLKQHQLSVDVEPGLSVMGQASLLERLLRNLIDNAIRYTPEPGTIGISAHRRGSLVSIAIQDTGIGLSDEHISHVFDRFWRASADRSDGGSGLGLAIASHICSAHGGSIRVTSQPGEGSCFVVELPSAS